MQSYSAMVLRARGSSYNSNANSKNAIDVEEELDKVSPSQTPDQSTLSDERISSKLLQAVMDEMSPIPTKQEKFVVQQNEPKNDTHNKQNPIILNSTKTSPKEEQEEQISFLISQKNKMLEEMSRRHENEIKMLQINAQQQQKQNLAQYTAKIEELTKQMDVIKSRNRELETKYEFQYSELQAVKNTLTDNQQQLLHAKETENKLKVMLIETQQKLQDKDEHMQRQQTLIFNLTNDLNRLQSQPPPLQQSQSFKPSSPLQQTATTTTEDFEKSPIKRIQQYKKTQELKKHEEENDREMSKLRDKYQRAKALIETLNNQKKELERKCNFISSNNETFNQRMNEIVLQVHTEAEKALLKANEIQKTNEELKKTNQTLKQMNERYFLVLKAFKEAEDKLTQKEIIIRELTTKNQELKKSSSSLISSNSSVLL